MDLLVVFEALVILENRDVVEGFFLMVAFLERVARLLAVAMLKRVWGNVLERREALDNVFSDLRGDCDQV